MPIRFSLIGKTMTMRETMIKFFKSLFGGKNDVAASNEENNVKRFLILCLGNIGSDYEGTRHNAGFMVGDAIADESGVAFKSCRYGDMAIVKVKNCGLMLLKPSTFMNLSGVAARFWMNKEKLPLENLLVIVDDISLPFGAIRIRERGSDAGHNGLKNIAEQLGTQNYARLKFGVGNDFPKGGQIDYVLGKFPPEEAKELPEKLKKASEAVKAFCLSGASFAMTHYNK